MSEPRIAPELVENVRRVLELRAEAEAEGGVVLNERVDIRLEGYGNGPFHVRKGDFEYIVDEPPIRAGRDTAPNPLAFFLGGAATCYLSHFMMQAISREMLIDDLEMTARGRFDRRAVGGHLQRVVYELRVESSADPEGVTEVAALAEKMCYAHNTLVKADVDIETRVILNGVQIAVLVADTSHL